MLTTNTLKPIFGVAARTMRGREQLTTDSLNRRFSRWLERPELSAWWIEREAGVALLEPQATVRSAGVGSGSALSICGVIRSGGRIEPPTAWPEAPSAADAATGILYDVLERDTAALRGLRGRFALACWDGRRRRLILSRDHMGQQALFTRTETDLLVFCSELSPLMGTAQSCAELDLEAAYWYLSFGMPPPGRTLARGVERIPAAHALCWEQGVAPFVQRYWTPLNAEAPLAASPDYVDSLQETLDTAIASCLAPDTSQGILLSGGTDSTYIAVTAASIDSTKLTAFTSAFEEELNLNDDARYAASVAEWLGIPHYVVPLHVEKAIEVMEEEILSTDEPCAAWASMTHFTLLARARELNVNRLLSGLGADEIFCGYEHFHNYYVRFLEYCERHPAPRGLDAFESLLLPEGPQSRQAIYPGIARFFNEQFLGEALTEPYRSWQHTSHLRAFYRECRRLKPEAHVMEMMVAHECQHRIPDLLFANFETISRRLCVDVGYPCLAPEVVEMATGLEVLSRYRTPSGHFSRQEDELQPGFKHALMKVYERKAPEAILTRPIKTFTAPFGAWFANKEFAGSVISRLDRTRFWERDILKREWLNHILKMMSPGAKDNQWTFQLWAVLTLVGWYDRFIDRPTSS